MKRNNINLLAGACLLLAALCGCQKNELNAQLSENGDIIKYYPYVSHPGALTKAYNPAISHEGSLVAEDRTLSIPMTCTTSEGINLDSKPSKSSESVNTKGSLINENGPGAISFDTDKTFEVTAWDITDTPVNIIPGTAGTYEEVSYNDSKWNTEDDYDWNKDRTMTFYAYSNLPTASGAASISTTDQSGQTLSYTVPSSASDQTDILMGFYSGDGKTGTPAEMTGTASIVFSHPLTAVQFKLGTIEGVESFAINSISITNVYASGTAEMTPETAVESDPKDRFTWDAETTTTVSQSISTQPTTEKPGIGEPFLLIPQSFDETSSSWITIACTINGKTANLYAPVTENTSWKAGYTTEYTLGYDANAYDILQVEGEIFTNYEGGTTELSVTSDSPWKLQYTLDGGITWIDVEANTQINDFLQFDKVSGMGSDDAQTVTATVAAATAVTEYTVNHAEILQAAEPKGTADAPYDLSMHTIYGETRANPVTANCYVINSAGWYAFPLVYGNAIDYTKNGETGDNVGAYYPNKSGTNVLKQFTDCNGAVIGSPFISGVANAYPLWEDVADYAIISNDATNCKVIDAATATSMGLALGGKCGYVIFHVNQSTLQQGNTVIAITDGNATPKIMWSWHIWVTDDDLTCKTVEYSDGKFISMFPENLGWVDSGVRKGYVGQFIHVRFVQVKGDEVKNEVDKNAIRERYDTTPSFGQSPTYQWGRKDPFIRALNMNGNDELSTYSGTFRAIEKISGAQATIAKSINNPASFYAESQNGYGWAGNGGGGKNVNLWSANYTPTSTSAGNTTAPVKTIYDPSPPGFQVPQGNAFTGFSLNSTDGTSFDTIKGFKFKVSSDSSEYIYFPGNGFRSAVGGVLTNIGERGDYWTAVPSSNNGKSLHFQNNDVTPDNGNNTRAYGFTVRPVAE